ncbi:MAG: VWA domain-containing protein [Phycisphaerae bacterium]|nr:VWA domain-containing protein [Phycisphaerae bacterium]
MDRLPRPAHLWHMPWIFAPPAILWVYAGTREDLVIQRWEWLWPGIGCVVAAIGLYVYGFAQKRRALRHFATDNLFGHLMPNVNPSRQVIKAGLTVSAILCIASAALGPRWGVTEKTVRLSGIDIMIVLDVSRSMLAEDVGLSRLERSKQAIRDLLAILDGDQVGLVTFAGKAVLKCSLTPDYGFYRLVLDEVGPYSAPLGGTLIGDAVRLAAEHFDDRAKKHKVILVITDGEDHESYPVEAAREAYEKRGIRVCAIGIGNAAQGQRIPVEKDGKITYLKYEGQEVRSKMDPKTLREMTSEGGGVYVDAGVRGIELDKIYRDIIAKMDKERREYEARKIDRLQSWHWLFALVGLILLVVEALLPERVGQAATVAFGADGRRVA